MSEPSRYVNNLLVLYKHHLEPQLTHEDRLDHISFELKSTILSALFCPTYHDQRFKIIKKPLAERLSKLNRLDFLTLYIENCHPSDPSSILPLIDRFVFFSYLFGVGTSECLHFITDLIVGEQFMNRELLWVLNNLTAKLPSPVPVDLSNAICSACDKLKNLQFPAIKAAARRLKGNCLISVPNHLTENSPSDSNRNPVCDSCGMDHPDLSLLDLVE